MSRYLTYKYHLIKNIQIKITSNMFLNSNKIYSHQILTNKFGSYQGNKQYDLLESLT